MKERELRNIRLSLYYRAFAILRQAGWWYRKTGNALKQVTGTGVPARTYTIARPFPLVFFNEDLTLHASGVKLYDNGTPMPSGSYTTDYLNCRFQIASGYNGPFTADLDIHTVRILDEFPDKEKLETVELPVIATGIDRGSHPDFSIGNAAKWRKRAMTLEIFARNKGERDDLTDDFSRRIAVIPLINMDDGEPLTEAGGLNPDFNYADQYLERLTAVDGVDDRLLDPVKGGSEKERYKSVVMLDVRRVS